MSSGERGVAAAVKFLCSGEGVRAGGRGRFVKCTDHRRRNCIIQEFVAKEESDRGKRLSGGRCETGVIFILVGTQN